MIVLLFLFIFIPRITVAGNPELSCAGIDGEEPGEIPNEFLSGAVSSTLKFIKRIDMKKKTKEN